MLFCQDCRLLCFPVHKYGVSGGAGGELQRFAIAVVAAQGADIYMIDEPSSFLDVRQRLKAAQVPLLVFCRMSMADASMRGLSRSLVYRLTCQKSRKIVCLAISGACAVCRAVIGGGASFWCAACLQRYMPTQHAIGGQVILAGSPSIASKNSTCMNHSKRSM